MFSFIFDLFTNFISFFTISLINIKNYFLLNCNNNIENLNIFSYIFYVFCDKFSNFFLTNSDTVWAKVLYELDGKYSVSQTKEEYVQHYLENLKNEENESKISNLCRKYGFPKPLNPHMECVILMYHENCTVMAQILLGIIVYLIVALFLFTNRSLKDVQKTSKHIEYLIDLGFIWIPTSIIFDLAGKQMYLSEIILSKDGNFNVVIDLESKLNKGVYFVRKSTKTVSFTERLLVK